MSKRFRKVRRTSKPNLEPSEPLFWPQKQNLEPTEPQKTERTSEPNQVRPNTSIFVLGFNNNCCFLSKKDDCL